MDVVLVDPSRTVLKFVTRMLEARNHVVRPFSDGPAALAYVRSNPDVSALITSEELFVMSGVELCWQTRLLANERRPIYIILMSSNQDRRHLIQALDCGADDFIGKPPVPEELYARLRAAERFTTMQHELIRLATTDPLTGTPNRRTFFEQAQKIWAQDGGPGLLSALMIDIDQFKAINDEHGHATGDEAIRAVARIVSEHRGIIGRFGGEEFAMLLQRCNLAQAMIAAEHMRWSVEALKLETNHGPLQLTCSFGVSEWQPDETIDQLLHRADCALYAAKSGGRNRVVAADEKVPMDNPDAGMSRSQALRRQRRVDAPALQPSGPAGEHAARAEEAHKDA
jgi:diguanylate cyclase (GGDEF)-like protein